MPKMRMDGKQFVILDDELDIVSRHRKVPGNAIWHWVDICSVPHTGTNFLHQLISNAGFQCRTGHTFREGGICPIRDPWETYVTWVSRGRDTDLFEQAWREFDEAYHDFKLDKGTTQKMIFRIRDDATNADTFNAIGFGFDRFE